MGILDGIAGLMTDPNQAAQLGLAGGLLSAGGPSRMPVSIGQAIGSGIQGMNQGYMGGLQRQMIAQQILASKMQNDFLLGKLQMVDALSGKRGPQTQKQATQQSLAGPVLSYGAQALPNTAGDVNQGGVGPTNTNAGLLNSATQDATSAPQAGDAPASMNGMTGQLMQQGLLGPWLGVNNSSLVGTALSNDPNIQRQLAIAKDPKIAQALYATSNNDALARQMINNQMIASGSKRLGNSAGIVDGKLVGLPGTPSAGYVNEPNGQGGWNAMPIGGGLGAVASSSAAESGGKTLAKTATTPTSVWNPAAGQQGSQVNPFGINVPGVGTPNSNFVPTEAPVGTHEATHELAKEYANQGLQLPGIKNSLDGLTKALDLVNSGIQTGPGSENKFELGGLLNTWHIPIGKDANTNYQLAYKYLSNANNQAMGAMGMSGSDARMDQFLHGNPNPETMNPQALKSAIEYVRGQQSGVVANYNAKTAWINAHSGNYTTLPQFNAAWGKAYNPNVMVLQQMNPAQGAEWLKANAPKGMTADQWRQQLAKKASEMAQLGAFQ